MSFLKNLESQQKTFPTFVQPQSTVAVVSVLVAGTLAELVHLNWPQVSLFGKALQKESMLRR